MREFGQLTVRQAKSYAYQGFGQALECDDCGRLFDSVASLEKHEIKRKHGEHSEYMKLFTEHEKEGITLFGRERWGRANIGWAQTAEGICSKVYGSPTQTLETTKTKDGYEHTVRVY